VKKLAIALCFVVPVFGQTVDPCTQTTKLTGGTTFTANTNGNAELSSTSPYGYEMWTEGGNNNKLTWYGTSQGGGAAFRAEWNNPNDFLGRIGYYWGDGGNYTTYKNIYADFNYTRSGRSTGGDYSYIGIYGWSRNNSASNANERLIEYYVVEDWFGNQWQVDTSPMGTGTTGGSKIGDITVDGATYDIIKNVRENKPSIDGTKTFTQIFSIRKNVRKCGTISVTEHFKKWENLGLTLGKMYESKFLVEAGGGTGWLEFSYLKLSQEDTPRGGTTPSSSSGVPTSSSSSEKVQATTCKTPLITYPTTTVPSDPYTACFKYTDDKCYVCKIENEGEFEGNMNTCASGWVWDGTQIATNLETGYWYQEVPCPNEETPILKNQVPLTNFSVRALGGKALRIEANAPAVVQIFDLRGNKAATLNVSGSQTINLSLPNGVYFAKARGMESVKFVLK